MASDGLFFLAIFLLFFGLWLFGGGPTKPISFAGPYITPVTTVGVTQVGYGDQVSALRGSVHISTPSDISRSLSDAYDTLGRLQQQANDLALFGDSSPYKGKVTISRGNPSNAVETEYISLTATRDAGTGVTISGWRLVSVATGNTGVIGQGTTIPQTGGVNPVGPITLVPGDRAIVATDESPIGVSFRENACIGYLSNYQHFYPYLPQQCPDAIDEFNQHFTGNKLRDESCYDLMRSTGRCEVPDDDTGHISTACFSILDNYLNYNGCVAHHQNDPDFAGSTWHIYLHRSKPLWKQSREAIRLLDQNGKTVDVYEY